MKRISWLINALVLVLTTSAAISAASPGSNGLYEEIKAFRIKQLSDAQLRKAWDDAEEIRIAEAKQIEARKQEEAMRRDEMRTKCGDVVFRTRNEVQCQTAHSTLWMSSDEQPRTREQIYDAIIVGMCNFLGKDRKALVKENCLPK